MDKPRNKEERAFWDAAFVAIVGGIEANPEYSEPSIDGCARAADAMLRARRERMEDD